MSLNAAGSGPQQAVPPTVRDDKIQIGNQLYAFEIGGQVIRDVGILNRVATTVHDTLNKEAVSQAAAQGATFNLKETKVTVMIEGRAQEETDVAWAAGNHDKEQKYVERVESIKAATTQSKALEEGLQALQEGPFSREHLRHAMREVFDRPNLQLAYALSGQRHLGSLKTLWQLVQERGNESLQKRIAEFLNEQVTAEPSKNHKECVTALILLILENLQLNPSEKDGFIQTFSKGTLPVMDNPYDDPETPREIAADAFKTLNRVYPNRADKGASKTRPEVIAHNVNLGCIIDQNGNVVVQRSGKSDSSQRLYELVADACLTQIASTDQRGLNETDRTDTNGLPILEFRHAVDTHLDLSFMKYAFAKENEREALDKLLKAQAHWPEEGIKVTMVDRDGQERTVILKRPIIRNQIMSGLAAFKIPGPFVPAKLQNAFNAKWDSGRISFVGNQQLLQRFIQDGEFSNEALADLKEKSQRLADQIQQKIQKDDLLVDGLIDFDKLSSYEIFKLGDAFFGSKEFKEYYLSAARFVLNEIKAGRASDVLYYALFQRKLPTCEPPDTLQRRIDAALAPIDQGKYTILPKPEDEVSAADIQIYTNLLLAELNLSVGKQCFSGKDRTSVSVALAVAQARFRQEHEGRDFLPHARSQADLNAFRKYFTDALGFYGTEATSQFTGEPGLKLGGGFGNPTIFQYLTDGTDGTACYVINREEGKEYSGRLAHRGAVLGLTDSSARKEAEALRDSLELGGENFQAARQAHIAINKFLYDNLHLPTGVRYFNQAFELTGSIVDLHLGQVPDAGNPRTRIALIEAEIARLSPSKSLQDKLQDKLQLYALEQLKALYEKRKAAKAAMRLVPKLSTVATRIQRSASGAI